MAIALVHQDKAIQGAGAGPFTFTPAQAPTAGNVLVLITGLNSTTVDVANLVTSTNVTWAKAWWTHTNKSLTMWYGLVGASPGTAVTVTPSAATPLSAVWSITEWSGLAAAPYVSGQSSATSGNSTTPTTPSGTPAITADALLIGVTVNAGNFVSGPTNGFTAITPAVANIMTHGYLIVSPPTTSYATAWTLSGAGAWEAAISTFKATDYPPLLGDLPHSPQHQALMAY